jgi:hypothetical protein
MPEQSDLHATRPLSALASGWSDQLRTLLILGRVSNLPTVWSNLLAGWILASPIYAKGVLMPLLIGGSFLYVGGMYLNDWFDTAFDIRYCPDRPIPAGKISRGTVGGLAILWFIMGFVCLAALGPLTAVLALLLTAAIVLYDCRHKGVAWAPLVMGACRGLLYLLAASSAQNFVVETFIFPSTLPRGVQSGLIIVLTVLPSALALGLYVAGITYLARGESRPAGPTRWALLLLFVPILLSCGTYAFPGRSTLPMPYPPILPIALIGLLQSWWMAWLLIPFWRKTNPSIGRVVSGLLAGIVFVDMIAVVPLIGPLSLILFPFFLLALLLQRVIPAT